MRTSSRGGVDTRQSTALDTPQPRVEPCQAESPLDKHRDGRQPSKSTECTKHAAVFHARLQARLSPTPVRFAAPAQAALTLALAVSAPIARGSRGGKLRANFGWPCATIVAVRSARMLLAHILAWRPARIPRMNRRGGIFLGFAGFLLPQWTARSRPRRARVPLGMGLPRLILMRWLRSKPGSQNWRRNRRKRSTA